MFKTRKGLLVILILLLGAPLMQDFFFALNKPRDSIDLSDKAKTHILYGNETGGGHLYGIGIPCKSEFPQDWTAEKIITTTKQIAANDNLSWERQRNGYYVAEQTIDGLDVRVVLDREKDGVITAYPTNVPRNPCPNRPAANDNSKTNN